MNTIPFRLFKIETVEFAKFEELYNSASEHEDSVQFGLDLSFGAKSIRDAGLVCAITVLFKQDKAIFLKIKTACFFNIEETFWNKNINDQTLTIPHKIADHMIFLTLGATRGILHAKTEGSILNRFILPQVDISDYIQEDVSIDFH